jgi:hypothetical protein
MAIEVREILIDGITQLKEWTDDALKGLTSDQLNHRPDGRTVSIAFNAWHVYRTADNIVNFVMRDRTPPLWISQGYVEKMGLPKVDQGTGMGLEDAQSIRVEDSALLREYGNRVLDDVVSYLGDVPYETLEQIQMIRPLGEMPKWRVFRQVCMTHGFMHLGEINGLRGQLGLPFSI